MFYEKYGKQTQGILKLSKVGFNNTRTQALVYYGNQSFYLSGAGFALLYEKVNGKWKKVCKFLLWIS